MSNTASAMNTESPPPKIGLAAPKATNVLIYEYGARLDRECVAAVDDQIKRGRALYNTLIECTRRVFDEARKFTLEAAGEPAQRLVAEIDELNKQFSDAKALDDRDLLKVIAQKRRDMWAKLSPILAEVRKAHVKELRVIYGRIGKNSACETYQLRSKAVRDGLGWATANAVLDNALKAWKTSAAKGHAPRFARADEKTQDSLTLQFTIAGGLTCATVLSGGHSELKLRPTNGCGPRRIGEFSFRLGTAAAAAFATGTWQYHRPIPENSHVGLARLVRRRIGKDTRYAIQLMVSLPAPIEVIVNGARLDLAAVHFGWASDVMGRRVAGICDGPDPGQAQMIRLPPNIEADLQHSADLQGERDESRDKLTLAMRAMQIDSLPDELREELTALRRLPAQHVASSRLHRLCRRLAEAGITIRELAEWRAEDRLRWQASAHIARRARNRRRDHWRNLAIDIASRYKAIAIEPLDLAGAAEKVDKTTGEHTEFAKKARAGRVVASVSELQNAIRWACQKTRTPLIEVVGHTLECAYCGGKTVGDQTSSHILHCTQCGAELDRKFNGAARAWQLVEPQVSLLSEEFTAYFERAWHDAQAANIEKKAKMAEGRSKMRASRADGQAAIVADTTSADQ